MSVSINGAGSITGIDQGFNVTTGSVGIGTDIPGHILDVYNSSGTDCLRLNVNGNAGGTNKQNAIRFSVDGDVKAHMGLAVDAGRLISGSIANDFCLKGLGSNNILFATNSSERLRITSAGNVGINDNNPTAKLSVIGNAYVSADSFMGDNAGIFFSGWNDYGAGVYSRNSGNDLVMNAGATERVRITSAGLVGVNCTSLSQFQVKTGTDQNIALSSMSSEASIEAYNDAGSANVPLRFRASAHKFFIGSTEGLRVHTNGLIGVGYDSPTAFGRMTVAMPSQSGGAAIQVANSSNGSGDGTTSNIVLRSVNNSANQWAGAEYRAADHIFAIQGTEKIRINSDGRLLINATNNPTLGGQTPYLRVNGGYTNLDELRIRGLDTGNTIWKTGGDMSLTVASNDAINLKTNSSTRFVLNANANNSTTLSIGNGSNLTNNTSPDRTSVKVGGTLHLEASFQGQNHRTGMYYNCYASGQSNFYQGTFGASSQDYRAAAATMRGGAFQVYTDPTTSTNYSAGAQITTMKETLTCTNGFVLAPNQPCFWATSNTGGSHTSNGYTGIISNQFEAAYVNVGSHFNTSTGVFTCPVAGTYEFHGQGLIRYQGGTGRAELSFYKNGSNTVTRSYGYTYVTGNNDHDNLHVMGYITCAVNDQIDLRVYAMDSGVDCYWGQGLGWFAGRLVQ